MNKVLGHRDFRSYFVKSETVKEHWKIGIEQEILGFTLDSFKRIDYQNGVKPILEFFANSKAWDPIYEGDLIIAVKKLGTSISIEPGGQLEISCAPFLTVQENETVILEYREGLSEISKSLGIVWYCLGYDPVTPIDAVPWVPKKRYEVMRRYLAQFGVGADLMMKGSCTAQSNFDYSSESDMVQKMIATTAFSSIIELLTASSPFLEHKLSGYKSYRNYAWMNLDPARCGFLEMIFDADFGYDSYISYILKVPMFVVEREGDIFDMSGTDFRKFIKGGLGFTANSKDWVTQVGSVFPVSRLRNAIETRTADSSRIDINLAQAAFWKGLLYDSISLGKTVSLAKELGLETLKQLHQNIYQQGFSYIGKNFSLKDITNDLLKYSEEGLERIDAEQNTKDRSYLEPFYEVAQKGENLSEQMIKYYEEKKGKNIFQILDHFELKLA